jgi:hypothetical protein
MAFVDLVTDAPDPETRELFDQYFTADEVAPTVRCFGSKTLDALAVEPDAADDSHEPELHDALAVGRPA